MSDLELSYTEWELLRYLAGFKRNGEQTGYDRTFRAYHESLDGISKEKWHFDSEFTSEAQKAARRLIARGFIGDSDHYGNRRLNESGREAAQDATPPTRKIVSAPPLVESDYYVLWNMERSWQDTMTLGGSNGSHHSASAMKMVLNGYAETKQRGVSDERATILCGPEAKRISIYRRNKGSRVYRITDAGASALAAWRAERETARIAKAPS